MEKFKFNLKIKISTVAICFFCSRIDPLSVIQLYNFRLVKYLLYALLLLYSPSYHKIILIYKI